MDIPFNIGIKQKLKERHRRGKPALDADNLREKGNLGPEKLFALDTTVYNKGDQDFRVISLGVRKVNGEKVLQRGTINESVVESGDFVEISPEFTVDDRSIIQSSNSLEVKIRTECGGKLRTEMVSLEDISCGSE